MVRKDIEQILKDMLGETRYENNIQNGASISFQETNKEQFKREFFSQPNNRKKLGEYLINLKDTPGFFSLLRDIRSNWLESYLAELQVAKMLKIKGIEFSFLEPTKKRQQPDICIQYRKQEYFCEIKCKCESTPFSEKTLIKTIKQIAKGQLKNKKKTIIFIKIPQDRWGKVKQNRALQTFFDQFLNEYKNILLITLFREKNTLQTINYQNMSIKPDIFIKNLPLLLKKKSRYRATFQKT